MSAEPRFRRAIVRPPGRNLADGLTSVDFGRPDVATALAQHDRYCEALASRGLEPVRLPPDDRHPDSTFVEDAAIVTARGAILTRPGAPNRRGEVAGIETALRPFLPALERITEPGTVDGGDICEAGDYYVIGISKRTNEAGARELAATLRRHGVGFSSIDIRDVPCILHLKSGIAWIGGRRLVAIDALAGHAAFRDYEILRVETAESYAANCVCVNDALLVAAGHPKFEARVRALKLHVISLDISEFVKMDGGLSCLSLRF